MSNLSCKKKYPEVFPPADRPAGLYLHVPFCQAKCRYCDFYSLAMDAALAGRYVRAAQGELQAHCGELDAPLASAFLGGGTPSVLGPAMLGELLEAVGPLTGPDTEWTVEVNPGTADVDLARRLRRTGVNRVSIGAQSFDADELRLLGRIHDARQVRETFGLLRDQGFENLGLDLIYGLPAPRGEPGQTLATWRRTLEQALELGPEHLSGYALSLEAGTPLEADLRAGKVREMDEPLQRACYEVMIDLAGSAGLEQYEISNFARPGRRCRHNLIYWHNLSYLGIGPAAASYVQGQRSTNVRDLHEYLSRLEAGQAPQAATECLTGAPLWAETAMLEPRLREGIDREVFRRRFGVDVVEAFPASIARYAHLGALHVTPRRVCLGREYLFVADTVLADIVQEGNRD